MIVSTKTKINLYNLATFISLIALIATLVYMPPLFESKDSLFLGLFAIVTTVMSFTFFLVGVHNTSVEKHEGIKRSNLFEIF